MISKILKKLITPFFAILASIIPMASASAADTALVSPNTGDETNVFLIIAILVAAAAIAVVLVILGKKNNK